MAKVKAHVLTVVYCEDGAGEPCLVVADLENGKKDILNIVHGIHATGDLQDAYHIPARLLRKRQR